MKLGDVVRDRISGLIGVLVSRHEYFNGCVRWGIQPREVKDGKPVDGAVLDEEQIEVVKTEQPIAFTPRMTGGDRDTPARQSVPKR